MIMPLIGFGYAHWSTSQTKVIKMHAGTVSCEIVQFHVDDTNTYDVNCDGVVWDIDDQLNPGVMDELEIYTVRDVDQRIIDVWIRVDPIYPSWFMEFKMLVHNDGRLIIEMETEEIGWGGPYVDDPTFLEPPDYNYVVDPGRVAPGVPGGVPPWFQYELRYFLHPSPPCPPPPCLDKTHYTIEVEPTTYVLKPCESVLIKQFIHYLGQAYPEHQCHWFRLAYRISFIQATAIPWGSPGYP